MGLDSIAEELRHCFQTQGQMPLPIRKDRLETLRKIIQFKENQISAALESDFKKCHFESYLTETGFILEEIRSILKNIDKWTRTQKVKTPLNLFPAKSFVHPDPYGVVLIIAPWNYPFQLCLSPFIGAIAAGNKVVVKPSEFAPKTSQIVKEILEEVFRKDEVAVIEGGLEETQTLLRQKFDYIFFTGSTAVGKIIMKSAAEHLTPVTLELGGKSPLIIEESANIDLAARRTVWGKFINAGQTCVAPDYVLISKNDEEEFIQKLKFYIEKFYGSNPELSHDYPRIINDKHFERLKDLIEPDKIAIGGLLKKEDRYIAPTVMRGVQWKDKIMEDEIFGPVLPIIAYDNFNEALSEVVRRPKPLAFYLFTENAQTRDQIIRNVSFGGGCINDTVMHLGNPYLPFGGVGTSGMGSYHGKRSFETFSHNKSILVQNTKVDLPLRYPPYRDKLKWIKFFFR